MPFDGNGVYNPLGSPIFPAVPGTTITASQYNQQILDMAGALSNCITRDGQGKPTANIDWNNFRITGLANAVNNADAVAKAQMDAAILAAINGTTSYATGALIKRTVYTGNATWTPDPKTKSIYVEGCGGGGAGGGTSTGGGFSGGAGGGAGAFGKLYLTTGFGPSRAVTIGGGGLGGAGAAGGGGNNTVFGSLLTLAGGGGGNAAGNVLSPQVLVNGAPGGAAPTNPGVTGGGGQGGGFAAALGSATGFAGQGGSGPYGCASVGVVINNTIQVANGLNGIGFGAGGGGGALVNAGFNAAGGNGTQGILIVWEFG